MRETNRKWIQNECETNISENPTQYGAEFSADSQHLSTLIIYTIPAATTNSDTLRCSKFKFE